MWYENCFGVNDVPYILNNMLNLKSQFWYLPQTASLALVGYKRLQK